MEQENIVDYKELFPVNEYQTVIDNDFINSMNDEVRQQFIDFISTVPWLKRHCSKDKPRAKDLPRDEKGRIIVDITKPHILEDMDYFRPTALHFEKYGTATSLRRNSNKNSPYGKWYYEEVRRCHEGYVRESDGEWITGDYYFFLNYCPMLVLEDDKEAGITTRYRRFPSPWEGHYYKFHYIWQARHHNMNSAELASRSKGKTASASAMLTKRILLGETMKNYRDVTAIAMAANDTYLQGADMLLDKFVDNLNFCAKNTSFPRHRIKDTENDMLWEIGYKKLDGTKDGLQNVVMGISMANKIGKGRGGRASLYIIEELGSFPKLQPTYAALRPSVKYGGRAFGLIHLQGTAGDTQSDFSGAQEMLRNPIGYDLYALENVFDKMAQGRKYFTYFFPGYIDLDGFYDKDGNSDVVGALRWILEERFKVKYNSDDPMALTKFIAETPIVPEEAMLKTTSTEFPTLQLNERIAELEGDVHAFDDVAIGNLVLGSDGLVKFTPTNDKPIRMFPHNNNKFPGAIEIFEMPCNEESGIPAYNRYILGVDPVDQDEADTVSLSSTLVLDLWTDRIVAEYTGRKDYSADNYEITRLLAKFYNGVIYYENNIKGMYAHFKEKKCLEMLADTPKFLSDIDKAKEGGIGNNSKGVRRTVPIINYSNKLISEWLLQPMTVVNKDGEEVTISSLYAIKNLALLKELSQYNPNNNFDRVCALAMLMIGRKDNYVETGGDVKGSNNYASNPNYIYNDDFFTE